MSTPHESAPGPAEEARRLVEALGAWATTRLGAADGHIATGDPECQLCPVCQLISALRGDRTEAMARLGDAWTAFLAVLTSHKAHSPVPDPASEPTPGPPAADIDEARVRPVRPVQNIDVR